MPSNLNHLFDIDEEGRVVRINPSHQITENSVQNNKQDDDGISQDRFSMIMSMYNEKYRSAKKGNLDELSNGQSRRP